ncbi:BlaR1 peptidase M56 [Sphingomonas gellani]|uniref:BlaR1 peptidase M56 n=1 Tax=Sphingomonas gellani TaxID=1166340 RepID=A0A1H8GRA5_9SPHN|nr:M56 family metallopeptidase [Sphingomonas gellani]SEN46572.1 BlaR1 peptidase M56 [Sphingomonas gellani]
MTVLGVLVALIAASLAGAAGCLCAAVADRWASAHARYTSWVLACWCGPVAAVLTIWFAIALPRRIEGTGTLVAAGLTRVAGPDRIAWLVAVLLLVVVTGAVLRLIGLARATAHVLAMIRATGPMRGTIAIPQRVPVRISSDAPTPMLAGWLRPVVLVPEGLIAQLDAVQLQLICEHEFTHARRRDNLQLWLEACAGALFWWCPAARWARRRLALAREESCDAAVLRDADAATRRTYAMTLLHVLGHPVPLAAGYSQARPFDIAHRVRGVLAPSAASHPVAEWLSRLGMLLTIVPFAISAGVVAARMETALATARPFTTHFARVHDHRAGLPIYRIRYSRPSDMADTLIGRLPDTQVAPARFHHQRDGSWRVTID